MPILKALQSGSVQKHLDPHPAVLPHSQCSSGFTVALSRIKHSVKIENQEELLHYASTEKSQMYRPPPVYIIQSVHSCLQEK